VVGVLRCAFLSALVIAGIGLGLTAGAARSGMEAQQSRWVSAELPGFCRDCSVQARALNERGVVVGDSAINGFPEADYHAALWEGGKVRDLGTLGGTVSLAVDIDDQRQVVGWSYYRRGVDYLRGVVFRHAFLWENGRMRDLGTLRRLPAALSSSEATAINDRGQVVGESLVRRGVSHAFLWENGQMHDLGTLPGDAESGATGINVAGDVVGWSAPKTGDGEHFHTVLWRNGRAQNLGIPTNILGAHINDAGEVVTSSGWLWKDGKRTNLCGLAGRGCTAKAINAHGQTIGSEPAQNRAWGELGALWQGKHVYRFHTAELTDINDTGQMVSTDDYGTVVGEYAYLWTLTRTGRR
jgi:probable HAF family extracellular repeat protein